MSYALIEHDRRIDLDVVKELAAEAHGAPDLWVDVSKVSGIVVGWVRAADGTFGPYAPPLAEARRVKLAELDSQCAAAITGGFDSSALGAPRRYGSSATDQANLDRAALASITAGDGWTAKVKCTPAGGTASFAAHDAAQLHAAVNDLHAWVQACRLKLDGLKAQVLAADATTASVQAITWG